MGTVLIEAIPIFLSLEPILFSPDVREVLKTLDPTVVVNDEQTYLTTKLAPNYGNLTSEIEKKMDPTLKVAIAGTINTINKIKDRSWETVVSALLNNPVVEPIDDGKVKS